MTVTSQTSKAALRSLERADSLGHAARTHRPVLSGRLDELFYPPSTAEPSEEQETRKTDWDQVQGSHADLLDRSSREVRDTDQTHRLNKVRASQLRYDRGNLLGDLIQRHRDYRSSFRGTYGPVALALVGLDAPPERVLAAIREQCMEAYGRMSDPVLVAQLPSPRFGQAPLDVPALAQEMKDDIDALDRVMTELGQMRKVLDQSRAAKKEAITRHRRILANLARIQEGYLRLVELDDLADRIRATQRAPRSSGGEEAEPGSAPENPLL